MNPNEKFSDLLADLERLRNSPPPKTAKITCFLSKPGMDQPLAKARPTYRQRREAAALKRAAGTPQPARQHKRSITVVLKKPEPLAKTVPAAPPRLVWAGRSGKVALPAGIHIEGWS